MIVQNADINVGPASYKDLAPDEMLVTSIFYTIQGEGPHAGKPALFIRLAGCNRGAKVGMGCEFCDTKFTFADGRRMTTAEVLREGINQIPKDWLVVGVLPLIVITGGEPMMQGNLRRLINHLIRYGFPHVQIESNGDRMINSLDSDQPPEKMSIVISPKITDGGYRELRKNVWDRATALKFVISGNPTSPYYNVPAWAHDFPREVYLSPMAEYREGVKPSEIASGWDHAMIDPKLTKRNYQRAAKLAMQTGFRVSIQQHLFLGLA